jgi:FAD/FMN-containing dehydrogenase
VTPTGDIVIASEASNPDLFWALRGGGASTYGIVTRVTYKTYPEPTTTMLAFSITPMNNKPESQEAYYNAIGYLFSMMPNFTDCGISGYPVLSKSSWRGALMAPNKSVKEVNDCWNPMAAYMRSLGASVITLAISNDVMTAAQGLVGGAAGASTSLAEKSGYPFVMGSRLLSRKALQDPANLGKITQALKTILDDPNMYMLPYPNIPGEKHQDREWDVALNPAWKKASVHVLIVWNDGIVGGIGKAPFQAKKKKRDLENTDDFQEIKWAPKEKILAVESTMMEKYVPALDVLSENHGAYINEASPLEKDWKTTFYGGGERYEKLLKIKQKYDPQNVLWCFPCVGGDVFTEGKDGKLYITEGS